MSFVVSALGPALNSSVQLSVFMWLVGIVHNYHNLWSRIMGFTLLFLGLNPKN